MKSAAFVEEEESSTAAGIPSFSGACIVPPPDDTDGVTRKKGETNPFFSEETMKDIALYILHQKNLVDKPVKPKLPLPLKKHVSKCDCDMVEPAGNDFPKQAFVVTVNESTKEMIVSDSPCHGKKFILKRNQKYFMSELDFQSFVNEKTTLEGLKTIFPIGKAGASENAVIEGIVKYLSKIVSCRSDHIRDQLQTDDVCAAVKEIFLRDVRFNAFLKHVAEADQVEISSQETMSLLKFWGRKLSLLPFPGKRESRVVLRRVQATIGMMLSLLWNSKCKSCPTS